MSERKLPEDFWTAEVPTDPFAMAPDVGADLSLIAVHEAELETIVQQMWEDMTTEVKLFEGTELPEREEIVIPRITEEEFRALMENERPPTEETLAKE